LFGTASELHCGFIYHRVNSQKRHPSLENILELVNPSVTLISSYPDETARNINFAKRLVGPLQFVTLEIGVPIRWKTADQIIAFA
jgi:hypothetical protein